MSASHSVDPSTREALRERRNGLPLRKLAQELGLPEGAAGMLSAVLRDVPGAVSLVAENNLRAALGQEPRGRSGPRRKRRKYLRPCLSLDPHTRLAQLAALMVMAQREIEPLPFEGF